MINNHSIKKKKKKDSRQVTSSSKQATGSDGGPKTEVSVIVEEVIIRGIIELA